MYIKIFQKSQWEVLTPNPLGYVRHGYELKDRSNIQIIKLFNPQPHLNPSNTGPTRKVDATLFFLETDCLAYLFCDNPNIRITKMLVENKFLLICNGIISRAPWRPGPLGTCLTCLDGWSGPDCTVDGAGTAPYKVTKAQKLSKSSRWSVRVGASVVRVLGLVFGIHSTSRLTSQICSLP